MKSARYKIIHPGKQRMVRLADTFLEMARIARLIPSVPEVLTPVSSLDRSVQRILLIRLAYIGDVVLTQPVIEPVRKAFPDARIDFLTSRAAAPLLGNDPDLDAVIPFDAPWFYSGTGTDSPGHLVDQLRDRYDLGFDFRGDIRNIWHCLYRPRIPIRCSYDSGGGGALLTHPVAWTTWKHKVEFHLDILRNAGLEAVSRDPRIHLTDTEITAARRLLDTIPGCSGTAPIAVHPGSRLPLKRWPVDRFVDLIRRLNTAGAGSVVLMESPGNAALTRAIAQQVPVAADLAGRVSIREMAALFHHCRVLICHDSAPMHIAAAAGCRVAAMFGPSRPLETAPCGPGHRIIEAECPVKDRCDENRCLASGMNGCMERISVDAVFHTVMSMNETPG